MSASATVDFVLILPVPFGPAMMTIFFSPFIAILDTQPSDNHPPQR
jgi:hypothetical protein